MKSRLTPAHWERVGKCWIWRRGKDKDGYGKISINRRHLRAHRVAYEDTFGKIPAGMLVLHSCDTPSCVNPKHLSIGTHLENHRQRSLRGRTAIGERSGMCKLTDKQVQKIRDEYATGATTSRALARKYSVAKSQILRILNGESRGSSISKSVLKVLSRRKLIRVGSESLTMSEWARRLGVKRSTLSARQSRGWTDREIVTTPIRKMVDSINWRR